MNNNIFINKNHKYIIIMSDSHTKYFLNYIEDFDNFTRTCGNQSDKYDIITRKLISLLFYINNIKKEWFELNDMRRKFKTTINWKLEEFLLILDANKDKIFSENLENLKKIVLIFKQTHDNSEPI